MSRRKRRRGKKPYQQANAYPSTPQVDYIRFGRPPLFKTPHELANLCNRYLNSTETPTIMGLYQHLGISRSTPGQWLVRDQQDYVDIITRAKETIMANYEQMLIQQGSHKAYSKMERPSVNIMAHALLLRIEAPDRYGDFALKDQYERRSALEQISSGDVVRNDVVRVDWNGDASNKPIATADAVGNTSAVIRDKGNKPGA